VEDVPADKAAGAPLVDLGDLVDDDLVGPVVVAVPSGAVTPIAARGIVRFRLANWAGGGSTHQRRPGAGLLYFLSGPNGRGQDCTAVLALLGSGQDLLAAVRAGAVPDLDRRRNNRGLSRLNDRKRDGLGRRRDGRRGGLGFPHPVREAGLGRR